MLRTALLLSVSILAVLANSGLAAAEWIESHKLTASDAARNDSFFRVAISGSTAIVGAPYDDDAGSYSGSAYLFDVAAGTELFKLTASDAQAEDYFGSVAINGNTAIVGAPGNDDAGSRSGSAYLFDVATGSQLLKLTPSDGAAGDFFGKAVAISGNTAIVAAAWDDDAGTDSGSAYLFDVATGKQLFKLTASDAARNDSFGRVAISGSTAIVGAPYDDDAGDDSGSAYVFDVATGKELFKLTASDAATEDMFGYSVAISGNTAIVGAWRDDDAGTWSGSAYLFDVATGDELFKLTASDAAAQDALGVSVAISGNRAIVGAWRDEDAGDRSGSAYLFDVATGSQLQKLTASDGAARDEFGVKVGISGNTAIVGAWRGDAPGVPDSGSAYVFVVPEPSSVSLLAMAALALLAYAWHRRRT